ncbi:sensor histidine kinase [Paenibacillus lycopersici]|uniref:histidine kinase n=1 Tax=Paenibacillus lycopersici TaxID=2704462 RepID=A0A6C0FQL9_9BACL|nr:sensor histidine kinase [Paenibacillus lycopersici]QHT59428.1 sensor histidine kinase [Paenibacillus lycopersici]
MKPTHRRRIVISAVMLTICAQLVFLWTGIRNAQSIGGDIERQTQSKLLSAAEYNVSSFFNHAYSMLRYVQNSDLIEYASSFLALRHEADYRQKRGEVDFKLNQIDFDENLIDSLYVIGQYDTQKNLVKHAGRLDLSDDVVPTIYDMSETGLLYPLEYNQHLPTYYAPGSLTSQVKTGKEEQIAHSKSFAGILEGHVVLSGGVQDSGQHNSTLVLIVLKKGFLADLVSGGAASPNAFELSDQNGTVLDRSGPEFRPGMTRLSHNINMFGFTLTMDSAMDANIRVAEHALYAKYAVFFSLIVLATLAITVVYSYYILLPFRKMSSFMRKQLLKFPLRRLSRDWTGERWFPSFSLRTHLFILFLLSVCIPAVSSGFGYYRLINQYTVEQQRPYALQLSDQVNRNLRLQMALYDDLLNKLSLNPTFNHLFFSDGFASSEMPDVSILQYPGIGDVSYFVLYNPTGVRRYASQMTNDTAILDGETQRTLDSQGGIVWSANVTDVFNQPTAALAKPFYAYDENTSAPQPIGYIQVILNASALQSMHIDSTVSIVTLDKRGDIYFHNDPSIPMLDSIKAISARLSATPNREQYVKTNGIHGIAISNPVEGSRLDSVLILSIDSILAGNREMFDNYLIVMAAALVVALFTSVFLTHWLVRPLERLKAVMEQAETGRQTAAVSYAKEDEIGELVGSFNSMMDQINQLMDTNIRFAEENGRNELKQRELLALKTQAELNMLQQQINPHFLYNTLQSIGMNAQRTGDEEVGFMIYALADLFRYSISHKGSTALLDDEIRHTQSYVAIQDFRFKGKFEVEWHVADEARSCRVITFILQPLVENAISHGFLESARKGRIRIAAALKDGMLALTVEDNGLGIERERLERMRREWEEGVSYRPDAAGKQGGVGLSNVYFRLHLAYKGKARMAIVSEPFEGTRITIEIPRFGM